MAKNSLCQHSAAALAGIENGVFYHDPVMLKECLDGLNIKPNGTYADCTLGGGGPVHLMDPAYYLSEIPVEIPGKQIILIAVAVLLLSVLVSYLPSRKAGKEKPLDILRNV